MKKTAETIRIEIPVTTIDNTEPGLSNLIRNLGKMIEKANHVGDSTEQARKKITKFDESADKTQKSLARWAKEKYQILLEAKDRISPIISTIGRSLKSFTNKTWKITMKAIDLATAPIRGVINLLKNPLFQVGAVLGISIGVKDTIDTYKSFEAAMSQVKAISGATGSDFDKLTEKAKYMGATTKFTATEAAEGFNYMAMAGWKTEDMLDGIEGIMSLAAASGESLGITSDIVTDALTAFGLKASDSGHFADVLAQASSNANTNVSLMGETFKYVGTMAGALGYKIEDVSLAVGLMANSGLKGSMAGTSLNTIMTRLATNTKGAADEIRKLGVEFYNKNGSARNLKSVMDELRAATKKMSDEEKSNLAKTVAGVEAQKGLLAILNATTEDYKKLTEAVNNADGAAQKMADIMMDNLQGSLTLLQSAADGVKLAFGERLKPYVQNMAIWLTEMMPNIEATLNELMDWVDKRIDRIKRKFSEIANTEEWKKADFFGKVHIAWDEFIAKPFSDWWNSTGKAKLANIVSDMGKGIGTGLKTGILTLLGIDVSDTLNEGVSIGAAFAKGFSEGFDFDTVSEKLLEGVKNLFSSALKLLPGGKSADISSIFSAMLIGKLATPFIGMGKGAFSIGKALFGGQKALGGISLGATGNAMVGGSGILGGLANVGYKFSNASKAGLYFGSTTGTMSGGAAALAGAGTIAGGAVGGATIISGVLDAYKAIKSEDEDYSKAYGTSAGLKVGGVAAGATIGTLILPGIGTAIGAGIGGITGWIAGNKVKGKYQENVEEMQKEAEKMQKEAERAQKVLKATGLEMEHVKFANAELNDAMNDSSISAEEFALRFQEECANVMKSAFGDISLSLTEIKKLAEEITFKDMKEGLEEFNIAVSKTDSSLSTLKNSISNLKRENWYVSLGMKLSETDKDKYKSSIDNFVQAAQDYIEDNHYKATVALDLLTNGKGDMKATDTFYGNLKQQIDTISEKLSKEIKIALKDGVITLDENKEIMKLQGQITAITNKLAEAKNKAQLQSIGIKFAASGAELNSDTFLSVQEELKNYISAATETYDMALDTRLTDLYLQRENKAITQKQYDKLVEKAEADYQARINEIYIDVESFNFRTITDGFAEKLDGILPYFKGTITEKLSQAMSEALAVRPNVDTWDNAYIVEAFDLEQLALKAPEIAEDVTVLLKNTAALVPPSVKEQFLKELENKVPTTEEILKAVDWKSISRHDYDMLIYGQDQEYFLSPDSSIYDPMFTGMEEDFDKACRNYAESIHNKLKQTLNPEEIRNFTSTYMRDFEKQEFDFSSAMKQHGPISKEYYEQLITQAVSSIEIPSIEDLTTASFLQPFSTAGSTYGTTITTEITKSITESSSLIRTSAENAVVDAFANPFHVTAKINITPSYMGLGSLMFPSTYTVPDKHAAGGYVSGGPQLSWLAEEGYGEYIIPTNPSRRSRALELYEQAGKALGITAHANGGFVGREISYFPEHDDNLEIIHETAKSVSYDGSKTTEEDYNIVQPVSMPTNEPQKTTIQVNVQMTPEFNVSKVQDEEDIMQIMKRHIKEMADELGGEIASKLETVFSNMPLKGME